MDLSELLKKEKGTDPWGGYKHDNWDEDSYAVVACNGKGNGCVLWTVGPHLNFEIKETGLTQLGDLGLDDAPLGISVWVGKVTYYRTGAYGEDSDADTVGAFRNPTEEEWAAIKENRCPWPFRSETEK